VAPLTKTVSRACRFARKEPPDDTNRVPRAHHRAASLASSAPIHLLRWHAHLLGEGAVAELLLQTQAAFAVGAPARERDGAGERIVARAAPCNRSRPSRRAQGASRPVRRRARGRLRGLLEPRASRGRIRVLGSGQRPSSGPAPPRSSTFCNACDQGARRFHPGRRCTTFTPPRIGNG
jgi:hypothetical protein